MFAFAGVSLRTIFDKRRGALVYIAKTSALSYVLVAVIIIAASLSGFEMSPHDTSEPLIQRFIVVLVAAPLLENIVLIGIVEFCLALEFRRPTIVVVIALLAGVAHGVAAHWRAVSGLVLFGTMTYSYLAWHESPFSRRYLITVMQHVLYNTPGFLSFAYLKIT